MKIFGSRFLMVAGLAGTASLLLNVNCGGSSGGGTGGTPGTGGTHTGGTTGTGGTHTGGTTGTGGTHTGGTTGTGGTAGASATGGTAGASATGGTAGASATGGAGGHATGGAGGAGGASNTDGGVQQYAAFSYTFDKNTQGFALNTFNGNGGNLLAVDGGSPPTLAWDSSVGSTGTTPAGSLKVDATYTGYSQFVQAAVNISPTVDATGKSVHAFVLLDKEDGGATWPGTVQLSASTGSSFNGFASISATLTPGTWTEVVLPLTGHATPFDPSQLIQIGVEFVTESKPDGGTFGAAQHRTFHIDTITDGSGLPPAPPVDYTFDTTVQGWQLVTSITTPDGGTAPALTWDATGGDSGGALKVASEFTAYKQNWSAQVNPQPFIDLTGKTITAKIKLDSGALPSTTSNYVQLHASSGSTFVYANAPTGASFTSTSAGTYMTLTFPFGTGFTPPSGFDVTQISQIGIQVGINAGPDGGVFPTPTPLTFHIDSVVAQ